MVEANHIKLFRSLFKGRDDVFATRWEKNGKSGYMPAYHYDPYRFRQHKMNGGTFQNFIDKKYKALSDQEIIRHINGDQLVGLYPLLADNTSHFIVADFDKSNWMEQCQKFLTVCEEYCMPAYLERSRSGNGGHVWIFFESAYSAFKSRKIIISLLEKCGVFSVFDKSSSFDRLFPNQDQLSGKGLGNLIALPLFNYTNNNQNSRFINPENPELTVDQWDFLSAIVRTPSLLLDQLFQETSGKVEPIQVYSSDKLIIDLSNSIKLKGTYPVSLVNFLKEELNFANTEYIIKKKTGKNPFGTERFFKLIEEDGPELIIPKGFIGKLIRFCKTENISFEFQDKRNKLPEINLLFNAELQDHQFQVIELARKKDFGVIVAPPGSGKTIMALKIIADRKQPALILVHRKQLLDQWIERIESFLEIPARDIGRIGQGKVKIGKQVTITMIQSLSKELIKGTSSELTTSFGLLIIDECHHVPAKTFRDTIAKFNTQYCYGLTATPFRKYNDDKLIFAFLGEIIAEAKAEELNLKQAPKVVIRNTELNVPFNPKTDQFETLAKILVHDSARNQLIISDISKELRSGKKAIVITERKDHITSLNQYLKQHFETVTLSGEDSVREKEFKLKSLNDGNFQVLITTGQFFGEGSDIKNINSLFLVFPFSFDGKLIQYIGRVQRSSVPPTIYDYRDIHIDYLNKMFLKRNAYYRKIERKATLFDDSVEEETSIIKNSEQVFSKHSFKVLFTELEFRFGSVALKYSIPGMQSELELDIENIHLRPEFEVLIPFFIKSLQTKSIQVELEIETLNGEMISLLATSPDIDRINLGIIDSVKFNFAWKTIQGKSKIPAGVDNTANISSTQLQELYPETEDLLAETLKKRSYKHSRQIQFLAEYHCSEVLKIRYVLNPFSFVFLLKGESYYHIILETLDTEEATYIWNLNRSDLNLSAQLQLVNADLNVMRDSGRQSFLTNAPANFGRIIHDYSDEKKGFVVWKDQLRQRMS